MQPRSSGLTGQRHAWLVEHQLWLVLALAALARLPVLVAVLLKPERAILASDALNYLTLAYNLAVHGAFSGRNIPPFHPDPLRTPGYPLFIAPFMLVPDPDHLRVIVVAQVVLGVLTAVGVADLGRRLFGGRVGLVAGVFFALAPMPVIMTAYVYSETLFTALLVAGGWLLVLGSDSDKWWISGLGGLVFGFAALVRPIGLFLLPLLVLVPVGRMPLRAGWRHAVVLALGFMILAGAWMGRNAVRFGRFSLAAIGDNNLYYYNVAGSEARRLGISLEVSQVILGEQMADQPGDDGRWPYAREGDLARSIIAERPLAFAWYNGLGALNGFRPGFSFMLSMFDLESEARQPIEVFMQGDIRAALGAMQDQAIVVLAVEVYMVLATGLLVVLSLAGLVVLLARKRLPEIVLLALVPGALLYLPGAASNARFRSPAEALLVILAAVGFSGLVGCVRVWRGSDVSSGPVLSDEHQQERDGHSADERRPEHHS